MDKIYLNELKFYGYHGVLPEENKLGQPFIIDVELEIDLKAAGKTDNLTETVNYASVYEEIKQVVEGPPFKLIEAVAEAIAEKIKSKFPLVKGSKIKVTKPNPPLAGNYHSVAIEILRNHD